MSSQVEKFEFKEFIPDELYRSYFKSIGSDQVVYVTVIQEDDQASKMYIERPPEVLDSVTGIVRLFYSLEDLKRYAKTVSALEQIPPEFVRRWEMSFTAAVERIREIDADYQAQGQKGLRLVATAIYKNKVIDLDVAWTSEQNIMV